MEAAALLEMPAVEARERLAALVGEVTSVLWLPVQRQNALLYVRGLVEQGGRKSLQPTLFRLGESDATYQSLQQFLADSAWDPDLLVRECAERVVPQVGVEAWIVDDTGIPKCGRHSPGVERRYSGTLGKIGNCQITVSVHAAGERGTAPLGWALYLPEEWCADEQRASWRLPRAPILADSAYGDDSAFRTTLHERGLEYVLAVSPNLGVFGPETTFAVPERQAKAGRPRSVARPDREPESLLALAQRLPGRAWKTIACRETPAGKTVKSRFAFVRVVAAHPVVKDHLPPRQEWLITEWPQGDEQPSDYWLSNLPPEASPKRLARLARLRWMIELDYNQLKGELGLDHYEGRSYRGFHHHTALVTCAHAFLTLERLHPKAPRPT